jgi:hypothetical protein
VPDSDPQILQVVIARLEVHVLNLQARISEVRESQLRQETKLDEVVANQSEQISAQNKEIADLKSKLMYAIGISIGSGAGAAALIKAFWK